MTEEEIQQAIKAAVATETNALKAKVEELRNEKKDLASQVQAAKDAAEQAEHDAAEKSNSVEDVRRSYDAKLKKLQDTIDARDKTLNTMLIDNAIATKIGEAGVFPHFSKAVTAMIKADAVVKNGEAMVGEVALADYISTFLVSDEGKHFVAAPANGGAGATGSTAKSSKFTKPPETGEEWDRFMRLSASNPAETNALADAWGRPDLKSV